jgi:nucleotide-binding universal stress UspA family protein
LVTKIVIGVDGSPASTSASEVGLRLAASMNAEVLFVHFSRLADQLFEEDPENGPSQDRLQEADPVLHEVAAAAKARGVVAELMVQDEHGAGMIAANLAGVAEGIDAEFVVVGNRGRSEVAEIVLGSVAHELLRLSARPVVVVHAGKEKPT